jgi:hypothetical protein
MVWLKLIGSIPFIAVLFGVVAFNRVTPLILGFPVLLVWCVFCVVLSSAVMTLIFLCDPANRPEAERRP